MVINIIYRSMTGHTRKLAKAIGEQIGVEPIDITKVHTLPETDLLFVGLGIYGGKPDSALMDYLDNLPVNKIKGAAIFSSACSGRDQSELVVNLLKSKKIEIYPKRFFCKGSFLFVNMGRPNASDLKKAKAYAQNVMDAVNG